MDLGREGKRRREIFWAFDRRSPPFGRKGWVTLNSFGQWRWNSVLKEFDGQAQRVIAGGNHGDQAVGAGTNDGEVA